MPPRRLLVGVGAVFLGVLGLVRLGPPLERLLDQPCPTGARAEHPVRVQLDVTVLEHQSWVQVPAEEVSRGMRLVACTDGKAIGFAVVRDGDLQANTMRVGVPTRWVLAHWVAGELDGYRTPERWLVVFPPSGSTGGAERLGPEQARGQ